MMMERLTTHHGVVCPIPLANIDTDQIIPKQFLKRVERTGYGQFLFFDRRFNADGSSNPLFALNDPVYADASILVTGRNFGCGSSREHAVWALSDYGFRVVIAPSFADIFANNAIQNGMLPVTLPQAAVDHLTSQALRKKAYSINVDLIACRVQDASGWSIDFNISAFQRRRLMEGLDDIGLTLLNESQIAAFEKSARRGA